MAKSTTNLLTRGFSGKLGGLVFRQCDGVTIIAAAPRRSARAASEKQVEQRMQFSMASAWARGVLQDPETAARYATRAKRQRTSSYALAMQDYLRNNRPDDPDGEIAKGSQAEPKSLLKFVSRKIIRKIA